MRVRAALAFGGMIALLQTGCINPGGATRNPGPIAPLTESAGPAKASADLSATDSAKLCIATAEQLEAANKLTDAVSLYERARQLDPRTDLRATRSLANLYTHLGEYDRAKDEFERALRAAPHSAELHNDLGYSYYSRGMWKEAEASLRKAVAADAKHGRAWTNLGMALGQQGRYDEAVDAFRHVVSPGKAYCNVAFLMVTQGRRDQALGAYREALRVEPDLQLARTALERLESGPVQTNAPQVGALPTTTPQAGSVAPASSSFSTARRNP